MLVILAGLPGTGKSSLGKELARRTGATYLRIDSIEQGIRGSSLGIKTVADAGYVVGYALAEDNLRLGRTVVADSVNPLHLTRAAWRDVAKRACSQAIEVELICSDQALHRARVEARLSDRPESGAPTWHEVLDRDYHVWDRDHIVIDTATRSVEECVDALLSRAPDLMRGTGT